MSFQNLPKQSRKIAESHTKFAWLIAGTPITRDSMTRSEQTTESREIISMKTQEGLKSIRYFRIISHII